MRQQPDGDQVRTAMEQVLAEADTGGKRPTVTAVEALLGVTHATFYRNYPELIEWFKEQTAVRRQARRTTVPAARTDPEETMAKLRRENGDLRRLAKLYAEKIRQLTVDNAALQAAVNSQAGVSDLASHRARRHSSQPD